MLAFRRQCMSILSSSTIVRVRHSAHQSSMSSVATQHEKSQEAASRPATPQQSIYGQQQSGNNALNAIKRSLPSSQHAQRRVRFADVGINLTDSTYAGIYHGRRIHDDDTGNVIQRAIDVGCERFMITGSDLDQSRRAIDLAKQYPGQCYATVGIHPCSANTLIDSSGGSSIILKELETLARNGQEQGLVAAFGEIGLDYDRLHLADKNVQLRVFEAQLDLAERLQLPLFLHSRAAAEDFERLLRPRLARLPRRGLVHSFTGSRDELENLLALGFDIGVNGCSLKTQENLEVVKHIPLERLQLETDGPWCEIRPSHASATYLTDTNQRQYDKGSASKEIPQDEANSNSRDGNIPNLDSHDMQAPDDDYQLPETCRSVKKEKYVAGCMVKGRNESCTIPSVAKVVARLHGVTVATVADAAWRNSTRMFGLGCQDSEPLPVDGPE